MDEALSGAGPLTFSRERRGFLTSSGACAALDDAFECVQGPGVAVLVAQLSAELGGLAAGVLIECALQRRAQRALSGWP